MITKAESDDSSASGIRKAGDTDLGLSFLLHFRSVQAVQRAKMPLPYSLKNLSHFL